MVAVIGIRLMESWPNNQTFSKVKFDCASTRDTTTICFLETLGDE